MTKNYKVTKKKELDDKANNTENQNHETCVKIGFLLNKK